MRLRERLKYHLFLSLLSQQSKRELKSQYTQWQWKGYSRIVMIEMILLSVLFFVISFLPDVFRGPVTTSINYISGISPKLYARYKQRYLRPWDPTYLHVRLLVRFCPILIPRLQRRAVLNRYKIWRKQALASPSSALNDILDHFESRNINHNWLINVRNIIEFTIWHHGRIEKPFHLRAHGQWALKDFPDPKCQDLTRYALAASIMEQLVDIFNWRSQLGMRRDYVQTGFEVRVGKRWDLDYPPPKLELAPDWTKYVSPAPEQLVIDSSRAREGMSFAQVLEGYTTFPPNPHFLKRNFIVNRNFMQFV
jgi:hypothetical protein